MDIVPMLKTKTEAITDTKANTGATTKTTKTSPSSATSIRVTAFVQNVDTDSWLADIEYPHIDGRRVRETISRAELTSTTAIDQWLMARGAKLPVDEKKRKKLLSALRDQDPTNRRFVTARSGWHGDAFVLPRKAYGKRADITFDLSEAEKKSVTRGLCKGTLQSWLKGVRSPALASSFLTFGLCVGFATPIAQLMDLEETAVFHLFGESNTGKTMGGKLCLSILGKARKKDLLSFSVTEHGGEDAVYAWNGSAFVIDELKEFKGDPSKLFQFITNLGHSYTAGVGHRRAKFAQRNKSLAQKNWVAFGITTGESSLDDVASSGSGRHSKGVERNDGHKARYIQIPLPTRAEGGCFDRLSDDNKTARRLRAKKLAAQVTAAIQENYGSAIGPFVEHVVKDKKAVRKRFREYADLFIAKMGVENDWERRFCEKFAYVYAGGRIAMEAGVMPVNEVIVQNSLVRLYKRARESIQMATELDATAFEKLLECFDDKTRFPTVNKKRDIGRIDQEKLFGFRRTTAKHGAFLGLKPEIARRWCVTAEAYNRFVDRLDNDGVLIPTSSDDKTYAHQVKGIGRVRYLTLRVPVLRRLREAAEA
jgi:hypothetical protein